MKSIYVIGSLRNPNIPETAREIRSLGFEAFDDWFAPGSETDNFWRDYEKSKGSSYKEALSGYAARHVFEFDKSHLDRCDAAVMVMPAGKSAHLELGYVLGHEKPGFILFDEEPERWDVMYQFATGIFFCKEDLFEALKKLL